MQGWDEDSAALWIEAMDEANLQEQEIQAASRGARLDLLSWNVARIPAGPPLTKNGARSKQAKEFEKFLRDLEKRSLLVKTVHARIHGDDRGSPGVCYASVSGAATLGDCGRGQCHEMYCESLLTCKRETLYIDVCWEAKKFRVMCSNLNPGSLDALVCEGFGGPGHGWSRHGRRTRKSIFCVDAQTGLGTGVPGAISSNIGPATTVTHRAEKQRLLECFIMEHLRTATNTFSNDDDGQLNIYTCNYKPQQIDYILSSDPSLRSRTFDSSATSSDHWGLIATIKERRGKTIGEKTRQETDQMGKSRPH